MKVAGSEPRRAFAPEPGAVFQRLAAPPSPRRFAHVRLLHTADWHLGARLGRHDRLPDQREALRGLLDIAQEVRPDLILHAGDLFDAFRPPYDALRLGVRALNQLAEVAPTLVVRGNHDSSELFRAIDELAGAGAEGPSRLRLIAEPAVVPYMEIASEPVAVACMPFIPPGAIVDYASEEHERFEGSYADGIRTLNRQQLEAAEELAGPNGFVLYAAHLHLHGAKPGNSERRITVGEDYATHPAELGRALYCAFGHIHDPQLLPGGTARGRYAGSLIPLDFGEATQKKEAVEVRIDDDGVKVERHPLPAIGRPLVEFRGNLDQLEDRAQDGGLNECILKARVTSDDPIPHLADQLAEWSPKCAVFNLVNEVANQRAKPISGDEDGPEPALEDLFMEWRASAATAGQRTANDERMRDIFAQAMAAAGQEARADFGAGDLAARARNTLAELAAERRRGGSRGGAGPSEDAPAGQEG